MPSPVDIITYIGVPLAVVGVMPVLYTSCSALIIKSRVQRTVKKNHLTLTTRVGLLAGVVEIDLPRFTIHTLPREDPRYWQQNPHPSEIKGGSWTLLNWQSVRTGKVTYRIQHSDELRQPQAEVEMGDLVTFLLDRGAEPSAHGLQLLRLMGLQTPPSTPILMCETQPVLIVTTPDESEGRLSFKLQWHEALSSGARHVDSLPPYWVRLSSKHIIGEEGSTPYPAVRLFLGIEGLEDARLENLSSDRKSTSVLKEGSIDHLRPDARVPHADSLWFACATVAVCSHQSDQTGLFRFSVPYRIQGFARRETIPHGVLVLLGMRSEEETPLSSERARLRQNAITNRRTAELQAQSKRMLEMRSMTQEQRVKAQMEDGIAMSQRMQAERNQAAVEELEIKSEALSSPRVGNRIVAEAALSWLRSLGKLRAEPTETVDLQTLAMSIVHAMVFDATLAQGVCSMLTSWIGWMDLLMTDVHFDYFKNNQVEFCYAAVLLNQIEEHKFNTRVHPVAKDLDECQRVYGKVFLG